MAKIKTISWSDVHAKRPVDDAAVAEHVARMEAEERAYRLRDIREEQGVTQKDSPIGGPSPSRPSPHSNPVTSTALAWRS